MTNLDFSRIVNHYTFVLHFKLVTPLHIGGNEAEAITSEANVICDANGRPFIPGSTLKGIFRTASERTAHLITAREVCFLEKETVCTRQVKKDEDNVSNEKDTMLKERQLFNQIYDDICPICQTYGGGTIASKVKFQHIFFKENVQPNLRTSNRINRETGAVADQALFSYESIHPQQEIQMTIEAENMTEDNLKILALALAQFQQNMLRLGGKQAKGLGEVKFIRGQVAKKDFTNKEQALKLLLKMEKPKEEELETFLKTVLVGEVK